MTNTGAVLNASQTTYANKVERILKGIDEAPFPGAYIVYAMSQGWTPAECAARGMELAL